MNILINVLLAIDMLVAVLMTLVILMQRPKSEGLGAAFGGGVTENIFGAQTTNVLTKFTGWLAGIFFVLTFVLGVLYARRSASDSSLHRELMGMPAATPAASVAPATGSPGSTPAARVPRTFRLLQPRNLLRSELASRSNKVRLLPLRRPRARHRRNRRSRDSVAGGNGQDARWPQSQHGCATRASLMTLAIQVSSSREIGSRSATSSRNCNKTAIGL